MPRLHRRLIDDKFPVDLLYASEMAGVDLTALNIGVVTCSKCGHQFIHPAPTHTFLTLFYSRYMSAAKEGFYSERAAQVIPKEFSDRFGRWLDRAGIARRNK